jgi:ferric-chelate reductase
MAAKSPGCTKKILIEGPYGGVSKPHMAQFDTILVIAGGSGGGFSLAMVDEALRLTEINASSEKRALSRRNLQVVFSTRDHAMADWYIEEIDSRLSKSTMLSADSDKGFETAVSVHVTDQPGQGIYSTSKLANVTGTAGKVPPAEITTTGNFSLNVRRYSRPDIPSLVARTVAMAHDQGTHLEKKQRVGVLVCGPASMLHDTRNAAALAQTKVLKGEVEELYLHSEPFV